MLPFHGSVRQKSESSEAKNRANLAKQPRLCKTSDDEANVNSTTALITSYRLHTPIIEKIYREYIKYERSKVSFPSSINLAFEHIHTVALPAVYLTGTTRKRHDNSVNAGL